MVSVVVTFVEEGSQLVVTWGLIGVSTLERKHYDFDHLVEKPFLVDSVT